MAPSNNENDSIDIKKDLNLVLDNIRSTGSFMTSANIHTAVNPGLYIPDVGTIGLPRSTDHANAIIQSCHPNPYGEGTEILVDDSVRKSWQLNASQFAFQNPRWQHQVELFVNEAEVKAELYKLLIYQEGAFSLPHRDSEKADGMFGTLAVCLPSKHEGGDVIVSHKDDQFKFQTAPTSKFGVPWAAWYADVTQEVKSVTSGYRVTLIYNLIHRPSAALLESRVSSTENTTRLLESWARAAEADPMQYLDGWSSCMGLSCPPALVYVLEHQYTDAELGFSQLRGVDKCRFAELWDACRRVGFGLLLANIEKKNMGGVGGNGYCRGSYGRGGNGTHRIRHLTESSLELSHVVHSRGVDMLIQKGVFDRDPDKESFKGFTGNEGASATHFYHETGALIIPRRFRFLFKIQQLKYGQRDAKKFLEDCHRVVLERRNDMLAKQKLLQVCRVITSVNSYYKRHAKPQEGQAKVMQIALELSDVELFCRAMEWLGSESFPSQTARVAQIAKIISQTVTTPPAPSDCIRFMTFLETRLDNTAFLVAFITSAHDYSLDGTIDKDEADKVLKALFSKIGASFKIDSATSSHHKQIKLVQLADATGNDSTRIINTLTEYTLDVKDETEESTFHDFLLPVANGLCAHIDTTKRSSTGSERRFIKHMLAKYVGDYVKEAPPSPPPNWKKKTTIRCICSNCASLRLFINDTSSTTKDFALGEKQRKHLDKQLDKTFFTTTTVRANPRRMRVEKTQALLVSEFKAWVARVQLAKYELDQLSQKGCLKEMLGNQYHSILSHQNLVLPDDLPALPAPRGLRNVVQRTVPAKRPFER
ncbi:hypothetical protein BDV24DRAFT_152562 [Aspergillus arachidicola]|uniref:Uncharacterized protein n=1 Tax=Aspergillus arachidicola TaxID=656916 RepID=A0A5N6Y5G4_9EURO|nr:hypothetical protein BDV24DRAFT_152562 [Aspergillus arachidicola]